MLLTIAWFQPPAPVTALGSFGSVLVRIRSIQNAFVVYVAKPSPGEPERAGMYLLIFDCLPQKPQNKMWQP